MSPERIINASYTSSSDIWSFGVSLLYMATGSLPYNLYSAAHPTVHTGMWGLVKAIADSPPPVLPAAIADRFSAECHHFLACCLRKQADERWDCERLLQHPWLVTAEQQWRLHTATAASPLTAILPSDMTDCEAIIDSLLTSHYSNNKSSSSSNVYRQSLFEMARFAKIGCELGIPASDVQQVFELKYQARLIA